MSFQLIFKSPNPQPHNHVNIDYVSDLIQKELHCHLDLVVESKASQLNVACDTCEVVAVRHSQLQSVSCIQMEKLEKL